MHHKELECIMKELNEEETNRLLGEKIFHLS
jgi:hypothetical protein